MPEFQIPSLFILFLTFLFIWHHNLKKKQRIHDMQNEAFWKQEKKSLVVRKKEIPADAFFHPNIDNLHFPKLNLNMQEQQKYEKLKKQLTNSLDLPMLSMSHLSNTELRLNYGTANQPIITQAEENYSAFLNFLYQYALLMNENNDLKEAIAALEEAIRLKSDISRHFLLLGNLYAKQKNKIKLNALISTVEKSDFIMKQNLIITLTNLLNSL